MSQTRKPKAAARTNSSYDWQAALRRAEDRWARRYDHRQHRADCWESLRDAAADHREATQLRSFIAEVLRQTEAMTVPPANVATWLAWATSKVERLDPLSDGPAAFLAPFGDVGTSLPVETLTAEDREQEEYLFEALRDGIYGSSPADARAKILRDRGQDEDL